MTSTEAKPKPLYLLKIIGGVTKFVQVVTPKALELMGKVVDLGGKVLQFAGDNLAPTLAVSSIASYQVWLPPLQSALSDFSTKVESQVILVNYLDRIKELIVQENLNNTEGTISSNAKEWLRASSFNALRTLDGEAKGYLTRFLAEGGLIKGNQPEVSLAGADLRKIDLHDAWLPDINLQDTYILDGKLSHTNLKRANLKNADLTGADLTSADLTGADLTRAKFKDAKLTGAHLDVNQAIQRGANFCHAKMPDGKPSTQPCL